MKITDKRYVCPRCDYPLVPVHAREAHRRRIIALTCPEPYCDHMQMVPKAKQAGFEAPETASSRKAVN